MEKNVKQLIPVVDEKPSKYDLYKRKFVDLTNLRFGKIVVKSYNGLAYVKSGETKGKKYHTWLCVCDCGREIVKSSGNLKAKNHIGCGCSSKYRLPRGQSIINVLYRRYKRGAEERELEFTLTSEECYEQFFTKNCHYCGAPPFQKVYSHTIPEVLTYTGIDRFDNTKGYIIENCVPCCKHCNFAKQKMSDQEFKEHIKKMYKHIYGEAAV